MKPKDTKHLQLRHNTWWLYYKIPKHLKVLPQFENHPALYTESLHTDSLTKAKQRRNAIIYNLNKASDTPYDAWEQEIISRSKQFTKDNPQLNDCVSYESLMVDKIHDEAIKQSGVDQLTGEPNRLTDEQQLKLDVITKKKPEKHKRLRFILDKVVSEKEANGLAAKSVSKIKRGIDWFLEHLLQDDIDITVIDYDQVHDFLVMGQNNGVSGSTLNGYLYGLRQVYDRAKKSKLVNGDSPFSNHGIPNNSEPYDPFTYDEIYQMYNAAEDDLKVLIHAAATTGARLGELMTAEVLIPSTYDKPCWLFKFKDKGKTEHSTTTS